MTAIFIGSIDRRKRCLETEKAMSSIRGKVSLIAHLAIRSSPALAIPRLGMRSDQTDERSVLLMVCALCCVTGELAAFLVELVVQKKLVVPKDAGDSSAGSLLYDFLHGEEAM